MQGDTQAWAEAFRTTSGKWPTWIVGPVTNDGGRRFTIHVRRLSAKTLSRNRLQRLYSAASS